MAEDSKAHGCKTTCMEEESIHGKMAGYMKESTLTIKSMALESILGQMEESMKDSGKMESNMEKENTFCQQVLKKKAIGKKVNVSIGKKTLYQQTRIETKPMCLNVMLII